MNELSASLNGVLRGEMTAVNQQFIHVLALRDWSEAETAARIMEVDRIDFPNAMRIIDYMVETETPIVLPPARFTPGTDYKGILLAEQAIEQRLSTALEGALCADDRLRALISTAKAPREAYAAWLAKRLNGSDRNEISANPPPAETAGVFGHLITMIEQSMVHSFLHWHRGDATNADAAWATSGAAMMHMTAFIHLFAARRSAPVPGEIPPLEIAVHPDEALHFDRRLAERCADEAATASIRCEETETANLCGKTAKYCQELSRWSPERTFPAPNHNSTAFDSFEATLTRFVWS